MRMNRTFLVLSGQLIAVASTLGGTASFVPQGPTSVEAGTDVVFEVSLTAKSMGAFDTADVIIGSDDAADLAFAYAAAWTSAFANVTTPVLDTGIYPQDVFVGGNNATSVGASLILGTIVVDTFGMPPGTYSVGVDSSRDAASTLGLSGAPESLIGSASFTILESAQACCTAEMCSIDLPSACQSGGGTPKGAGTDCADGDVNGIPDVCEACVCQLFGDVAPVGPPDGNCVVDVDDILCVLDGFSFGESLCPSADLAPCGGNLVIDVDDILVELDAFTGFFGCPHPCAPEP